MWKKILLKMIDVKDVIKSTSVKAIFSFTYPIQKFSRSLTGAPAKPMSGTLPASVFRTNVIASYTYFKDSFTLTSL